MLQPNHFLHLREQFKFGIGNNEVKRAYQRRLVCISMNR